MGFDATIDDRIDHAVVHRHHCALAGINGDITAGHLGNLMTPGPGRIDYQVSFNGHFLVGDGIFSYGSGYLAVADQNIDDFVVGQHLGSVFLGRLDQGLARFPGLNAGIRYAKGAGHLGVQKRFPA